MGAALPAFVPPARLGASSFASRPLPACAAACARAHNVTGHVRSPVPRRSRFTLVAVQLNAISGDHGGEVEDSALLKSYSVGVTIVSGCDADLRQRVIENMVAESGEMRVVVVTGSGLASTLEPDGAVGGVDEEDSDSDSDARLEADSESSSQRAGNGVAAAGLNGAGGQGEANSAARGKHGLEGWLSCSSPDEMAEVIAKLAASRDCDYIIAEGSTGAIIDARDFASLLQERGGASLRVDTLVSVLDGESLLDDLHAPKNSKRSEGNGSAQSIVADNGGALESNNVYEGDSSDTLGSNSITSRDGSEKPVVAGATDQSSSRPMAIVSLVENANVIVVNQRASQDSNLNLRPLQNVISVLNFKASIVPATDCVVPVDEVINTNMYDPDDLVFNASWKMMLMADRNNQKSAARAIPKALKEATFVYRARRPFHPTRLYEHIKDVQTFSGIIRSTGKIWLATRMLAPLEWNQAGESATLNVGKFFWAALPESEWPSDSEVRSAIMANWDKQFGDRETEMVFVGIDIDKERLQGLLDGCLLQDEEMVFTNLWENFDDPFIEWVPLIDEDEEPQLQGFRNVQEEEEAEEEEAEEKDVKQESRGEDNGRDLQKREIESTTTKDQEKARDKGGIGQVEGEIDSDDLPSDLLENASALEVLEKSYEDSGSSLQMSKPNAEGEFDENDVVLSSWDGTVAEGILQQIPKKGLPVTIVTGFLGSGKTTLLNYILTADHGLRIAVLVNEFGEIDIDSQLVEKGDWEGSDDIMQLANGCICCSINDSFITAVQKVLERKNEVDYLVIETTGVADPVPIINSLLVSDIADHVRVDGILTVVDAENFDPATQMGSEAALSQILTADTILLSKTDIAPPEKIEDVIAFIKSERPAARILRSQKGRVPIGMILDVGVRVSSTLQVSDMSAIAIEQAEVQENQGDTAEVSRRDSASRETVSSTIPTNGSKGSRVAEQDVDDHPATGEDSVERRTANDPGATHSQDHDHTHHDEHECGPGCTHESHSHDHTGHLEADGFVTTSFKSDRPLVPERFMDVFLQQLPEGVFRAKGLLYFYGYGQRYVFQLSGRRFSFEEDEWPEGVAPGNQLVVIGRDLDIDKLRATLEECHANTNS